MNEPTESTKPETYIAHYKLGKIIGRGGMGLVYLAEDTRLNRRVAIKCLRTELFEPHYRERFRREALLLAKLNHPHIVHIYDYIESDDQMALVMEYIDGQNLQSLLREQIVPIHQRMRWLVQIAQGLAVAHEAGIIHRDLKQENILINKQGMAKISDLGIAKSQDFNATLTDHVAGSYCSMSPEQAMGETLSFKSDLFSFGILAYQLLCGTHPFGDAENKLQIMQRIITHPPIAPSKSNPDLPAELGQLLGQLLSKNPERRPDSTHWVAGQLELLSDLLQEESPADDTIAIGTAGKLGTLGRATRAKMTREHATFETRYQSRRLEDQNRAFFKQHWALLVFVFALVVAVTGVSIWQMQPKPPKYVAVIPPVIMAEGMDESQQRIIKNVVYDALQQGVLQLRGFYLVPQEEVISTESNIDQIKQATSADEIINTEIHCRLDSCTISLTRLVPEDNALNTRLRVKNTRSLSVLTDDYRSIAEFTQSNLGAIYSETINNTLVDIDDQEYETYIQASEELRSQGASRDLLSRLDQLSPKTKKNAAVQTLYRETILDLYYESGDNSLLTKLESELIASTTDAGAPYLYSLYGLQIAQNDLAGALETVKDIELLNPNPAETHKLYAHTFMASNDYSSAIDHYKKAIGLKSSAHGFYNIALAYWYSGNYALAEQHIEEALKLIPNQYKFHRLKGIVALVRGNAAEAITSFQFVARDDDFTTLSNLGISYLLLHQYEDAYIQFEKASKIAPHQTTLKLNMADALTLAGRDKDAKVIYQEIASTKHDRISSESLRNLAQANAHLGNFSEAIRHIQELQKIDPQNVDTTYTAALVYTLTGEQTSALVNVENAIENNLSAVWFSFPWFSSLCTNQRFHSLISAHDAPSPCTP